METFDVVVIGAGPGGYPAAIRAAQLGAVTALIEKERVGGTCLNWGCIPTKSLIAGADLYYRTKHGEALGLGGEAVTFDYNGMHRHKDTVVGTLRSGVEMLLKANGVKVFAGLGSFEGRNRIAVAADGAKTVIETAATIVATGSDSVMPGFLPKAPCVVDSRKFLEMTKLPASLLVMGGGVIGCEFACMAAQLGAKVTIVEMLEDILMILDTDLRRELRKHMERTLGIRILTGKPLEEIRAGADGVGASVGGERLDAEVLLVSIGRRPVTQGLDLAKAGLTTTERGYLQADASCATRAASVYAIGDVTEGTTQLAHAATAQGMTAAENAVRGKRLRAESLIPSCIFTSPEIGTAGLSEAAAKAAGREVKIGRFAFAALGKALAGGESAGFVKWIADAATDQLLGAQAVGPHATDLIAEATAAIRAELTAEELGRTVHCHPTLSEIWMEAAHAVHGTCIHTAPRKRPV